MKILYFSNAMETYDYIWGALQNKNFTIMNVSE